MRSPSVLGLLSIALGLGAPSTASAQAYKDNASPPIDVPTTPVPQGPQAPPPAPTPKAQPKPAPTPATPSTTSKGNGEEKKDGAAGESKDLKYNNEGVFKVSGSKGAGVVGGAKDKKSKQDAATAPAPKAGGKAKASAANVAQWPGFRLTEDGGSEVMVEFSKNPAPPSEHRAAGSVTYVFKGAHVIKSNNQNPLITVHFNTPVVSARLLPKKGELHLVIHYRPGIDPAPASGLRASADGDGQQFFVKFPSGSWLPKGAENEEMPPPPTQKLKGKGNGEKSKEEKPAGGNAPPPPKTESGGKTGPSP